MTWTILAFVLQLADGLQTCAALRNGDAREANPVLGSHPSCGQVMTLKAVALSPLVFPLDKQLRMKVAVVNSVAGGIGVGASVVLYWSK